MSDPVLAFEHHHGSHLSSREVILRRVQFACEMVALIERELLTAPPAIERALKGAMHALETLHTAFDKALPARHNLPSKDHDDEDIDHE